MRYAILSVLSVLGLALLGCDTRAGGGNGGRMRVVATTTMIGDLVKQIAGDRVDLVVIMPAGTDPHTYKPTPKDLADVRSGTRVFYNGLHLEGKMVDLLVSQLAGTAIAVSRDIPRDKLLAWKQGEAGAHDPHIWFDVSLWMHAARTVKDELAKADPANASLYQTRLDGLLERLEALDTYVSRAIASIPASRRALITSHDAFNYYGRRYGLEVRGLQGISTESQAGITDIQEAARFIVARRIPAIFVESSVNPANIKSVQNDCRAQGIDVKLGGELYSDAMGRPGEHPGYAVETYDGMVRYNTDLIVKALRGE